MMKKILFIFSLLGLLLTPVIGQLHVPAVASSVQSAAGYSAEYQAVYDAMTTPPSAPVAVAQNTMVVSLVADGVWAKLDIFYVFAQESNGASEALINWIDPGTFNATLVNTPTWTSLEGFLGNGSSANNASILSNYDPSTDGTNFSQNSASIGGYHRVDLDESKFLGGSTSGTDYVLLQSRSSNAIYFRLNHADMYNRSPISNGQGFFVCSRVSSSDTRVFQNGSQVGAVNAVVSNAPISADIYFLSRTNTSSSNNQIACGFVGGGLSVAEVNDFNTAFEAYMVSNAKGVQ